MTTNSLITVLIAFVLGLGGGYLIRGGEFTGSNPHDAHSMPGGVTMSQDIDQHFITQMIPHHEGAIAMAEVALDRSKDQRIRSLAEGIIGAQKKEITDMEGWYRGWYGSTPTTGHQMMQMGSMTGDIDALRAAPAAQFESLFLAQMIPHHEMAVMMADMLQAGTERQEMKILADQIITSQTREIEMMRSWLRE